ncbi:MAG: methyltransferase domain-containing protein [Acidimicrobiia bacterium]|nr:methyltransferase domain-containing protein [Acidimicrobiia bacterium]MBT8247249.1 methyltransferase domain-containing protein [Acidimicrobiia bacterium]NNF88015.1 class I SAM-dependent methyltransferase [Acidimicrobiia bacterium]
MNEMWSNPVSVEAMYGDWGLGADEGEAGVDGDFEAATEILARSLDPRPSKSIFDTIGALGIGAGDTVLDIGGRDGLHALAMAGRFGCRVVAVDPVEANVTRGLELIAHHEHGHLVEIRIGTIEQIPAEDGVYDAALSRDMLGHIADPAPAFAECLRVLRPGGAMVVHEVFATALLEPEEERRLCADIATYPERLSVAGFESDVQSAGFSIESLDLIGSEWSEASQESGAAPNYLLQVSRLRRARERLLEELGEVPYRVMYGNALWSIYQLIGKLESRVYVLRKP